MARGAYRHVVTFQNPGPAVADGDGAYTQTWTDCTPPTWYVSVEPAAVTHAIHLLTAYLYEDRGDGSQPDVWPKIYALLAAYRDPTVA